MLPSLIHRLWRSDMVRPFNTLLLFFFLVFCRIYAEDGAILLKVPVLLGDPFIGRINVISVPPPRTAKTVKCSIAKIEKIKDGESISLFLTPYSQSPMDDADKAIILNPTGTSWIHATGSPSACCKDVRLRTKCLGVRWEWNCECC